MIVKEFGDNTKPTVILLHGGGLSWWSLEAAAMELALEYHVLTPVLDGHGEDGDTVFVSIEESARKLLAYIDECFGGKVFALGGLSIGAQIVTHILSIRPTVTQYAIIESALVCPIKSAAAIAGTTKLFYGLTKKRWFAKWQAKALCVPDNQFERYFKDSLRISKLSLVNMTRSNGNFKLRKEISKTAANVLVLAGEKEIAVMRRSADMIREAIPNSVLRIIPNMKHGELSLTQPTAYVAMLRDFFAGKPD